MFLGQRATSFDVMKLRMLRGVKSPEVIKHGNITFDAATLYNCVQDLGGPEQVNMLLLC